MDNVIGLVNRIQRACSALGDYRGEGAVASLWEALPSVVVVGGQSSGKSSVLESIVGRDFLPRGFGIVTRRPLGLQLHKNDDGSQEYAEFLHVPRKRTTDFDGQSNDIMADIGNTVRFFIEKPNLIFLAVSPANQDIATSDAIKIAREVNPDGVGTFGVLTKLDLTDKGTNALNVLEGRSYLLQHQWVGVVNRSQQDINKNVNMIADKRREREYFVSRHNCGHLASKMGSEYLAKVLAKTVRWRENIRRI